MSTVVVAAVLALSVVLVALVVARPQMTAGRAGKILAFVALFVLPVFAGLLGVDNHIDRSKQTQFCLSCHIMGPYGRSLYVDDKSYIPAAHFQNNRVPRDEACYTCHTDYTLYTGGIKAKIRGLHHIYAQYIGTPHHPIKLYHPFKNRECLHCHLGARSFEEGATHSTILNEIKTDQISCVSSGCHDMVHNVAQAGEVKYWSPQP